MANDNSSSHFFVDYTALDINPVTSDAFGPVEGSLTTKYRTTSFVNSSGTGKVLAICKGRVLILPHAENTQKVNLVLKPESSFGRLKVKYFIYRNVDKGDLIAGAFLKEVDENDPNQPAFLKRMWKEYIDFNMPFYLNGTIPDPPDVFPAAFIGYNENPNNISLDKIFNGEGIIGEPYFQLPMSKMGEHLANFSEQIGLDVVLDYGDYQLINEEELFHLDINFARKAEHIFDISADIGTAPDPITIKRYREHILQFMDAAAFWGSFIPNGSVSTISDDEPLSTPSEIGTKILTKFFTKNKVYLYIQGEHERTYNYFDTSRKVYGFEVDGELAQTNEWPILIKEISVTSDSQTSDIKLEYEIENYNVPPDDDEIPVIQRQIILDVVAGNSNPLDSYPKIYRPEDDSGQTDSIKIKFYGDSTKSYSTFVFIYANLKQKYPVENYFNSLWTINIDTPYSAPDSDNAVYYANYNRNRLVNLDDTMGVGANIQNKVVFDNGLNGTTQTRKKRRLYMAIVQANSSHDAEDKSYNVTEITAGKIRKITRKEDYANLLYNDQDFAVYRGSFTDDQTNENILSLSLIHHKNLLKKKSYYHLGITDEEYNKLVYNTPNPTSSTPQYLPDDAQKLLFYLEEDFLFPDGNETLSNTPPNTRKYRVGITFEDSNGNRNTDNPQFPDYQNEVNIYSTDGFYFFSKEYSDHQEYYRVFSKGRVEFRTLINDITPVGRPTIPAYGGEFFFDWLRVNDGNLDTRPRYRDIIETGYHRPEEFNLSKEFSDGFMAYRALTREYFSIPMENDEVYHIPYLSLFSQKTSQKIGGSPAPPYQAHLRVYIDFPEYVCKVEFEFDNQYLSIDPPALQDKGTTTGLVQSEDGAITITCKEDFKIPQQIYVWLYPQGQYTKKHAQLAGIIIINRNDSAIIKEPKIALINVWTDVTDSGFEEDYEKGSFDTIEKIKLYNTLYQNLWSPKITDNLICDLTDDDNFKVILNQSTLNYDLGDYLNNDSDYQILRNKRGTGELIHNYLSTMFLSEEQNAIYEHHFLIFAFDRPSDPEGRMGHVAEIGKPLVVVYNTEANDPNSSDPPRSNTTVAHEVLHGYGLYHTHQEKYTNGNFVPITEPEKKYTYPNANSLPKVDKPKATDNIMSYYHEKRSTVWQWQRKFIIIPKQDL